MDTTALKQSWREVAKVGDEATQYFYSHLFLAHPEVREMFPISMTAQRSRFFTALGHIVSNVDDLATDPTFVEQLGRDHRRFDVVADHYPAVAPSLLATLRHFLGPAWTEQLEADWTAAYEAIAGIMIAAAADAERDSPPFWEAEVVAIDRRSIDVAVVELRPDRPYPYLPGQSMAVEVPSRPKLWRYYSPANAPRADGSIELHVQIVPGGQVSTALARGTARGEIIRLGAPIGDQLTLSPDDGSLLLVAGGTGLAPLRAVLDHIDERWRASGSAPEVHLFHGARAPWNLYDHQHLRQLAARPWLQYTPVVSDDPGFPGVRGLVGDFAARARPWHGFTALVCGSAPMVSHTRAALHSAGLPPAAVRFEEFADAGFADGAAAPWTQHAHPTPDTRHTPDTTPTPGASPTPDPTWPTEATAWR
ncbi:globin domain-containing protein [Rhodococcus sp. NPDC054953]